jgi:hypothetical protein
MRWLARLLSSCRLAASRPSASELAPGDRVWSGADVWQVTAVLVYRAGDDEWPVLKLIRGPQTVWLGFERTGAVRYDPLPGVDAGHDGLVRWEGRIWGPADDGTATITRAVGDVEAAPGDRLRWQTLTSDSVRDHWLSIERWEGGPTEVSTARQWRVDRIVRGGAE